MTRVSYIPLWKKLLDKGMNRLELAAAAGFSTATLAKLGKNEYVALSVIEKICVTLDCPIEEVVSIRHGSDEAG
jgi:DNA-binding Xre family transcriptional regulator